MIKVTDFNHTLHDIAKEGKFGKWTLRKTVDKAGSKLCCYSLEQGSVYRDQLDDDWKGVELRDESQLMMTDNPFEQESYKPAINDAVGHVLVCGLGIGLFNVLVEEKIKADVISKLTIVEHDSDLVDWVTDYMPMNRTHIVVDDAWNHLDKTGERYDFIFIDIWPTELEATLDGPIMTEKAKRCLNSEGTVRFWMQEMPPMMGYM